MNGPGSQARPAALRAPWRSVTTRVMSLTTFGMGFALLLDVLIAARLGTSVAADTLIVAVTVPLMLDTIARMSISFSLVPVLVSSRSELEASQYARFVGGVLNSAVLLGLAIASILMLAAPWIVTILAPGLPTAAHAEAGMLLRLCSPMVPSAFGIAILAVLHNSERRFVLVASRSLVAPAIVVAALLAAWTSDAVTRWVAAGYSVGYAAFFAVLLAIARRNGLQHRWAALLRPHDVSRIAAAVTYPTLTFALRQGAHVVERTIASFVGTGGVATYYFAFRIFSALQTIVGHSAATTALPGMSELGMQAAKEELTAGLRRRLWRVALVTLPVLLVIVLFHDVIVRVLFERGAFDRHSAEQVSRTLLWLGASLTFFCAIPVLQAALHAQRRYDLVFMNALLVTVVGLPLAWMLSRSFGVVGIAMGVSLATVLSVVNLVQLLHGTGVRVMGGLR